MRFFPSKHESTKVLIFRFENVIVPVSLWQSPDNSTLMYVSSALKLGSIRDVCKRNFAHIVSYYLPHSVAEIQGQRAILKSAYDSNDQLNKAGDKARKLERLISQTLGMEEFQAILTDRVAEVIAQVQTFRVNVKSDVLYVFL